MVKFGGSTRIFILEVGVAVGVALVYSDANVLSPQSPGGGQDAVQEEAENEIQDISQQEHLYKKAQLEQVAKDMEQKKKLKKKEEEGVMWGMGEGGVVWGMSEGGVVWGMSEGGVMWGMGEGGVMWGMGEGGVVWGMGEGGLMWGMGEGGVMWGMMKSGIYVFHCSHINFQITILIWNLRLYTILMKLTPKEKHITKTTPRRLSGSSLNAKVVLRNIV